MSEPIVKSLVPILPQTGQVVSITVRPERGAWPLYREQVQANKGYGLDGDHFSSQRNRREVTLMQAEHLTVVADILLREVTHDMIRRNILVSGINLLSLIDRTFWVGEVVLQGTGPCHPCEQMEKNLGPGGYNAMRGHGGITACIMEPGTISLGDPVRIG